MSAEHDQHHQQLADRMKAAEDWFGAHMQAHQNTLDPNIRQLNDRVKALEGRLRGGGVSEARVRELIRAARLSI